VLIKRVLFGAQGIIKIAEKAKTAIKMGRGEDLSKQLRSKKTMRPPTMEEHVEMEAQLQESYLKARKRAALWASV